MAHAIVIETVKDGVRYISRSGIGPSGGRSHWRCSCGDRGGWMRHVRSARDGGARHVAMAERSKG